MADFNTLSDLITGYTRMAGRAPQSGGIGVDPELAKQQNAVAQALAEGNAAEFKRLTGHDIRNFAMPAPGGNTLGAITDAKTRLARGFGSLSR